MPRNRLRFTNQPGVLSITPKDKRYLYTLGSRIISFYDVQMINEHYGCNGTISKGMRRPYVSSQMSNTEVGHLPEWRSAQPEQLHSL